jgi:hypothetical protein
MNDQTSRNRETAFLCSSPVIPNPKGKREHYSINGSTRSFTWSAVNGFLRYP